MRLVHLWPLTSVRRAPPDVLALWLPPRLVLFPVGPCAPRWDLGTGGHGCPAWGGDTVWGALCCGPGLCTHSGSPRGLPPAVEAPSPVSLCSLQWKPHVVWQ